MSAFPPVVAVPESRKVLIALPWYRSACPLTAFALATIMDRRRFGVSLSFGDAFVVHARNKLATQFLSTTFEWMLMLDDDMIFPFGNAEWFNEHTGLGLPEAFAGIHTIDRLLSHEKTLIGATYFGRSPGAKPVFADGAKLQELILKRGPEDRIVPTRWVGTGCLLIHRTVFLDIEKKFPHLSRNENNGNGQWFTSSEHDLHSAVDEAIDILSAGGDPEVLRHKVTERLVEGQHKSSVHSVLGMGEDVQLCVRATQAGHTPFVDLGLWAGHVGSAVYPLQ